PPAQISPPDPNVRCGRPVCCPLLWRKRGRAKGLGPAHPGAREPGDAMHGKPDKGSPKAAPVDAEALARNLARLVEEGGRALAAYLKPREEGELREELADDLTDVVKTFGQVAEYWMAEPARALEAQTSLMRGYMDLWAATMKRMAGEITDPVAKPEPKDARFSDPEWTQNPFFDTMKQAYLITAGWAVRMVHDAQGLDEHTKHKADFYPR